jgi:heme oxygenase
MLDLLILGGKSVKKASEPIFEAKLELRTSVFGIFDQNASFGTQFLLKFLSRLISLFQAV